MSFRVEWFSPPYSSIDVLPAGTEFGEHHVTEEVAVVFDGDEGAAFEGPAADLRARLVNAIAEIDRLYPNTAQEA